MNTTTTGLYTGFKAWHKPLLDRRGIFSFALDEGIDPVAFFGNPLPGLTVAPDFLERIVSKAMPVRAGTLIPEVDHSHINGKGTEDGIEAALKRGQLEMDETNLCAILAQLITLKFQGKLPQLDSTNKANLLYTSDWVVVVRWDITDDYQQSCYVCSHYRNILLIGAEDFVFSPALRKF